MIQQAQVMPLLLGACPTFSAAWGEHVQEHGDDLLYVAAGSFANHLLSLFQSGQSSALAAVGAVVEELHVSGSPWVREFATIGLLEGIQNVWSNNNTDPESFRQFLGPESQRWWAGLNNFWSGQSPRVQADG